MQPRTPQSTHGRGLGLARRTIALGTSGLKECGSCRKWWQPMAVRDLLGSDLGGLRLAQGVRTLQPKRFGLLPPTGRGCREQLGTQHALMNQLGLRTGRGRRNSSVSPLWGTMSHWFARSRWADSLWCGIPSVAMRVRCLPSDLSS